MSDIGGPDGSHNSCTRGCRGRSSYASSHLHVRRATGGSGCKQAGSHYLWCAEQERDEQPLVVTTSAFSLCARLKVPSPARGRGKECPSTGEKPYEYGLEVFIVVCERYVKRG